MRRFLILIGSICFVVLLCWAVITWLTREDDGRFIVVTTAAPVSDIVKNIAGPEVQLHRIITDGKNIHRYEPSLSDRQIFAIADLIILNGLGLDQRIEEIAQSWKKTGTPIVHLGEEAIPESQRIFEPVFPQPMHPDPHAWLNPQYAKRYAETITNTLSEYDPPQARTYRDRYYSYAARLDTLDESIRQSISTIPSKNKKLLTYHDAWRYFARRYGLEVVAPIQSTDYQEPSVTQISGIIQRVKSDRIPVLFGSVSFPSLILEQISKAAGGSRVIMIREEDLPGSPTDVHHTYIGMMQDAVHTMVVSLGGSTVAIDAVEAAN